MYRTASLSTKLSTKAVSTTSPVAMSVVVESRIDVAGACGAGSGERLDRRDRRARGGGKAMRAPRAPPRDAGGAPQ